MEGFRWARSVSSLSSKASPAAAAWSTTAVNRRANSGRLGSWIWRTKRGANSASTSKAAASSPAQCLGHEGDGMHHSTLSRFSSSTWCCNPHAGLSHAMAHRHDALPIAGSKSLVSLPSLYHFWSSCSRMIDYTSSHHTALHTRGRACVLKDMAAAKVVASGAAACASRGKGVSQQPEPLVPGALPVADQSLLLLHECAVLIIAPPDNDL